MTPRVNLLLDRADEALEAARYTLDGGFVSTAVNRTYYAAFHAARAALLTLDETPKTHAGVLRRFLAQFVQTGRLDDSFARALPRAYQLRQEADYEDGALIEPDAAEELLDDVTAFVQAVGEMLGH